MAVEHNSNHCWISKAVIFLSGLTWNSPMSKNKFILIYVDTLKKQEKIIKVFKVALYK